MPIRSELPGAAIHTDHPTEVIPNQAPWWADLILVLSLVTAFLVVHVAVPGAVPSGADPGGWLAMAKERFGGEVLAARDATYLPGFPLLLGSLSAFANSVLAITLGGLISKVALVLAVYLVVRPVGRGYAAAAAVMVGMSGAHGEMYAWGGYPQQLGTALGVVAVFYLVRFLATRSLRFLAVSAIAVASTLATHNLVGGLLVGALFIAAIHWLYLTGARSREWVRGIRDAAILVIPSGLFVAVSFMLGQRAGRQPSINPNELTWADSIQYTIGEASIPWLVVCVIALALGLSRRWSGPHATTVAVGGAWILVSVTFFFLAGEPRALLLTQMGVVMVAIPGFAELFRQATLQNAWARDLLAVLGAILLFAVVVSGYTDYDAATDWYRVVSHEEIAALDHLEEVSDQGDLVVASVGQHGVQMGWWVQGYTGRPTYPGGSINFLASPQERAQGATANQVFGASSPEAGALLDQIGARFVVVDRRGASAPWLESEFARSLEIVDDRSNLVILELPKKE